MRAGLGRPVWYAIVAIAFVAAGCHRKESVLPPVPTPSPSPSASASPSPSPTPVGTIAPTSAQTSTTLDNAGGSLLLSSGGLSGTLTYPGSNATGAVGAAFTMNTQIPSLPSPQPTGTPIVAFTLQLSATATFTGPLAVSPVTLPSSFSPNGASFFETLYDTTAGVQLGTAAQGTVSGQTLTFTAPAAGSFAATAGDVYAFVVSYGSGGSSGSTFGPTARRRRVPPR